MRIFFFVDFKRGLLLRRLFTLFNSWSVSKACDLFVVWGRLRLWGSSRAGQDTQAIALLISCHSCDRGCRLELFWCEGVVTLHLALVLCSFHLRWWSPVFIGFASGSSTDLGLRFFHCECGLLFKFSAELLNFSIIVGAKFRIKPPLCWIKLLLHLIDNLRKTGGFVPATGSVLGYG